MINAACDKLAENKQENITGTWQVIPIAPELDTKWIFSGNNKVNIVYDNDTNIVEGTYSLELSQARYYLMLDSAGYLDGKYLILRHNKEIMILQRIEADYPGAFLRREFVKL